MRNIISGKCGGISGIKRRGFLVWFQRYNCQILDAESFVASDMFLQLLKIERNQLGQVAYSCLGYSSTPGLIT